MSDRTIHVTIRSRLPDVELVGRATRALCAAAPGLAELAGDVELCVVEAVTNAIEHACGGRSDAEVRVGLCFSPAGVEITVADTGPGMPAPRLVDARRNVLDFDPEDVEALPERGLGLAIMRAIMDEVRYERGGGHNVLRLRKLLGPDPAPRRTRRDGAPPIDRRKPEPCEGSGP